MVTSAYVQGIFRRHNWRFRVDEDGDIHTGFDGVPIVILIKPEGVLAGAIAYRAEGRERQALMARVRDVEFVLATINMLATDGYFEYDDDDAVFYMSFVSLSGNATQDDARLIRVLQLNVAAVKGVGPIIAGLVRGQITVQDALDRIKRAWRGDGRGRGVA